MSSTADRAPGRPVPPLSADRGAEDVVESLYRGSGRRRPALPRYEPALRPPEDADGYAWLYRPEPGPETTVAVPPVVAIVARAGSPKAVPRASRRWGTTAVVAASGVLLCVALGVSLLVHLL